MATNNITYEIVKPIGVISANDTYSKQVNIVAWNNREPVYDIRIWKMGKDETKTPLKGISLNATDLENLKEILSAIDLEVEP